MAGNAVLLLVNVIVMVGVDSGHIHRLEIENFKSYEGQQVIGPFNRFQAIIGPNGAGKSNLMDAISFVLGVRTGQLRGKQLKDLIFRCEGEDADTGRSASVGLVFKDAKGEVFFRRMIRADGSSVYKINNKTVSWDEYDKALMKRNILVKARNFLVFQGDVEAVASKSPSALMEMFEHISGSESLKAEYEELKAKKEQAEEHTIFNFQKKKGIAAEKKHFKEQKAEAERFQELLDNRASLQSELELFKLFHIDADMEELEEEMEESKEALFELEGDQQKLESDVKEKKKEASKLHVEAAQAEKKVLGDKKEVDKLRPALVKTKAEMKKLKENVSEYTSVIEKFKAELKASQKKAKAVKKELKAAEDEEAQFEQKVREDNDGMEIELVEDQLRQYNALKEEAGARTFGLREDSKKVELEQKRDQEKVAGMRAEILQIEGELVRVQKSIEQAEGRKEKLVANVSENKKNLKEAKSNLENLKKSLQSTGNRNEVLVNLIQEGETKLRDAKADLKENERDQKANETVDALKRLFPSVHGRLLDLTKPTQRKYNVPVTVAMGANMDAIVVDDEKTALHCIAYLKQQRLPVKTFLPLDRLKYKPLDERLRNLGGSAKIIVDVIEHDMKIRAAVLYAVGNSIVCDELDEAKQLSFRKNGESLKVVTVDGTLIHKSGLMTGGMGTIESKAQRWNQKGLEGVKRDISNHKKELQEIRSARHEDEQRLGKASQKVTELSQKLEYSEMDLKITTEKLSKFAAETKTLSESKKKITKSATDTERAIEMRENSVEEILGQIRKIEDEVFHDFSQSVGVTNMREYEEQQLQRKKRINAKRLEIKNKVSKLQHALNYEESRDLSTPIQKREKQIEESQGKLDKLRKERTSQEEKLSQAEAQVAKKMEKVDELKKASGAVDAEMKDLKKKLDKVMKAIAGVQDTLNGKKSQEDQLKEQRIAIFKHCKLEQIDIPLVSGSLEKMAMQDLEKEDDDALDAMDVDEAHHSHKSKKKKKGALSSDIVVDYQNLAEDHKNCRTKEEVDRTVESLNDKINSISSDIEKMAPNMKATDQLDGVQARFNQLTAEFEDARKESKKATEAFNAVKNERSTKLMEAFTCVQERIDGIYKELTKSATHPLGGTAYLSLENPDEPYLSGIKYHAMPPTKRFRDIEQMSGGEKTVAALALLFAIHSYQPSPFFVLDEVDAALDNANVNKVSNFIKSRSEEFQCIVISLKDSFFHKADALVGIYRNQENNSSQTLTLDLTKYE